ncbi:uncharacterized protein [Rutidosis leptorrhynchoides]|uniref:uncharacterized protein n=1 Tax=Rutidosis leptorrhynchoides TaxID=125765 RepID=UPI003A99561E
MSMEPSDDMFDDGSYGLPLKLMSDTPPAIVLGSPDSSVAPPAAVAGTPIPIRTSDPGASSSEASSSASAPLATIDGHVDLTEIPALDTIITSYYSQHCNDFAHEAIPTDKVFTRYPFLEPVTSHYTGGQNILDQHPPLQRSIYFVATPNLFETNINDTYKIQARLIFYLSDISNVTNGRRFNHNLEFDLDGFWSVSSNKLCMVGSANWFSKQGESIRLDAVLKLKFARFISLNTSLVSGILESLVSPDDPNYFQPISMLGFPRVAPFKYNYTVTTSNELACNKIENRQDSVTSIQSLDICTLFTRRFTTYILKYPSNCNNCSLFSGYMPIYMSLYAIQCSREGKKARFLVEFNDRRFTPYDQSFDPNVSLIGEGTWSGTKDEMCITACRILNQSDPLGSARVGDCSIRLTLWFPATRSINRTHTTEGHIFWNTNVTVGFQSFDHSLANYGRKYEYTQMEKVRQICPKKRHVRVHGKYQSGDYKFDMSVKYNNMFSSGYAVPIFVGDHVYNNYTTRHYKGRVNISYEVSFRLNTSLISGISSSINDGKVDISAEGVYDDETGQICMVGCRNVKLYSKNNASFDCEILVKFQLPQGNESFIKGSIETLREKQDVLFFDKLDTISVTYTETEARKTIWRMDLEMILVLVSDTLSCIFIAQQLYHLKKKTPEIISFVSFLMMLILTLGHLVPLLLNFEAMMFSNTRDHKNTPFCNDQGWLQVRIIISMAAFVLQLRVLKLTWTSKKNNHWVHEIWSLIIYTYISIGSIVFLVNWKKSTYSIHLGIFAGLILDGFLLPQIVLNIFQISKSNALSYTFYIGTTFVRLLPHVYDLSRGPKSIGHQFDRLYIYANPRADLYTPSWDIAIVCAGVVFAVIIFLQQRFGGRFMLSKRFHQTVESEMVSVESN